MTVPWQGHNYFHLLIHHHTISRDELPYDNRRKVSSGNACIPIWKVNAVKRTIKKAAKNDGEHKSSYNSNIQTIFPFSTYLHSLWHAQGFGRTSLSEIKIWKLTPDKWRDQRGKIAQKCVFGYGCYTFWKPKKTRHEFGVKDNAPADLIAQGAKNAHKTDRFFHTGYC
jgi:hypothetical protein